MCYSVSLYTNSSYCITRNWFGCSLWIHEFSHKYNHNANIRNTRGFGNHSHWAMLCFTVY